MPSLNDYNGIVQTKTMACGAFALAAALHELGFSVFDFKRLNAGFTNYDAPYSNMRTQFAEFLYEGTGNLPLALTTTYGYVNNAMNSPSALVYMANHVSSQQLTIAASVLFGSKAMTTFQGISIVGAIPSRTATLYQNEVSLINLINCKTGQVPVNDKLTTSYDKPGPNECQLLLVGPTSGPPDHWLAANSSEYYDPALGTVAALAYNSSPLAFGFSTTYEFAGLWISLKS
jgi:hypothetical protein